MLEAKGLCLAFGGRAVLRDCDLRLAPGERLALMGPSGCGKTTLLRVLLSLQRPDSGEVRLRAARVGAVFQEPRLLPWRTALENVNLVLSDRAGTRDEALRWLRLLELEEAADSYPAALSGGMRQRVALARALAVRAPLLVLDEPFKAMDEALHGRVLRLTDEAAADSALLLATHSEAEAEALGCRVLRYRDGRFA